VRPAELVAPPRRRSELGRILRRAWAERRTRFGAVLAIAVVLVALLGPLLAPHSPTATVGPPFAPPGGGHPFGTDVLGRGVLSRFLAGGFAILWVSVAATGIGMLLGAGLGMAAGYLGGRADETIMRLLDVILSFPQLILALLFVSMLGPKLWLLAVVIGVSHVPRVARVLRTATAEVAKRDFVLVAEAMATPRWRVLRREILPNVVGPVMVEAGLRLTFSIGLVAGLSFLGFGVQPPAADWGSMIEENQIGLTVQPWGVLLPVFAIALLTVGTNFVTDGIARATIRVDRVRRRRSRGAPGPGGALPAPSTLEDAA